MMPLVASSFIDPFKDLSELFGYFDNIKQTVIL